MTRLSARFIGPALAAATIGAGAVLAEPAIAFAEADLFGAIVIDNAGNWWAASGQSSAEIAEKEAKSACGDRKGCDVVITWKNGCAAVARKGEDFDGETASTLEEAQRKALDKIDGMDIIKTGTIVTTACNEDESRVVAHDDNKPGDEGPDNPGSVPA